MTPGTRPWRTDMKRILTLAGAAALVLAGAGTALASIPDGAGVIHGCYSKSGDLKIIDPATATCPGGTTPLSWSQTGPQGPAGTSGTDGVSGYEVVAGTIEVPNNGSNHAGTISCPAGKVVLGGGVTSDEVNGQPSEDGTGWDYTFMTPGGGGLYGFRSSITCAAVTP
jgi:hypothetical protein